MTSHRPLPGAAHPLTLIREGIAVARASLGATILLAAIVAGLCLAVFATAGQAAAAEQEVSRHIDQAGTRLVTVQYTAPTGGLDPRVVHRCNSLTQVTWCVGLGPTADARNAALQGQGRPAPARTIYGRPSNGLPRLLGRWPAAGEGVVSATSQRALGLRQPVGAVKVGRRTFSVVGRVAPAGLLEALDPYLLVAPEPSDTVITTVYILADRVANVPAVHDSIRQLLGATDPTAVTVSTSGVLTELSMAIRGELGASKRAASGGILGAGIVVVGLSTLATVSSRKRDFGRRRALGASRGAIIGLVLVQVATPAVGGALAGSVGGLVLMTILGGALPSWQFTAAVPVLTAIAALVASVPVAYLAARRDPVRILRVP